MEDGTRTSGAGDRPAEPHVEGPVAWVPAVGAGGPVLPVAWPVPAPRRPHRRGVRGPLSAAAVIGLSLAAAVLAGPGPWPWAPVADGSRAAAMTPWWPPPGVGAAEAPLGGPPPAPSGGGTHAFVDHQDDGVTPVAYDPCRAIRYVLGPGAPPPGAEGLVQEAADVLARTTGLQLVDEGTTAEPWSRDRPAYQPDRYGQRWAPVLIAWQTAAENPSLAGDVVGEAGSIAVTVRGEPTVYVTGSVSLDATDLSDMLAGPDGRAMVRAVVLHELGHLVGLDHVDDPAQLMYPESVPGVVDLAAGDLTGLSRLGRGACVPDL